MESWRGNGEERAKEDGRDGATEGERGRPRSPEAVRGCGGCREVGKPRHRRGAGQAGRRVGRRGQGSRGAIRLGGAQVVWRPAPAIGCLYMRITAGPSTRLAATARLTSAAGPARAYCKAFPCRLTSIQSSNPIVPKLNHSHKTRFHLRSPADSLPPASALPSLLPRHRPVARSSRALCISRLSPSPTPPPMGTPRPSNRIAPDRLATPAQRPSPAWSCSLLACPVPSLNPHLDLNTAVSPEHCCFSHYTLTEEGCADFSK